MKYLCIVPYEYTVLTMLYRNSPVGIYKVATKLREQGHEVELFNMFPMYRPRTHLTYTSGGVLFKGIPAVQFKAWKKCGNFESEGLYRRFSRIGLPLSELTTKLESFKPDEVYVGNTFTFLWRSVYEIVAECKRVRPQARVTVGGIYAMLCPDHAAGSGADHVATVAEMESFDRFHHVDPDLFGDNMPDRIFIGTSTGCPNQCSYCAIKFIEGCQRTEASVDQIINEMKLYISRGVSNFIFLDANILINFDNHFRLILQKIIDEKMNVTLTNYGGIDARLVNDANVSLMVQAGFKSINIPIEDADETVLKKWDRQSDDATWLAAVKTTQKYISRVRTYMMIGAPEQSTKGIKDTLKYVQDAGVEPYTLPFTPVPLTPMYAPYAAMDLEDLNPALYPCAHDKMKVAELHKIYGECRNVPFDDIHKEDFIDHIGEGKPRMIESGPPIPIK